MKLTLDINVDGENVEIQNPDSCEMWFEDAKTDTERLFAKSLAAVVMNHIATVNSITKALFEKPKDDKGNGNENG